MIVLCVFSLLSACLQIDFREYMCLSNGKEMHCIVIPHLSSVGIQNDYVVFVSFLNMYCRCKCTHGLELTLYLFQSFGGWFPIHSS